MMINFYSNNITNNFEGPFTECDFNSHNSTDKTNYSKKLFDSKNRNMNNEKLIDELKELLCSKFHCDIAMLAKEVGVSPEEIYNFIMGISEVSPEILEEFKKYVLIENVDKFYAGDSVAGDKIIIKEGGMNKYSDSAAEEKLKMVKKENTDLKELSQEKDDILKSYEEIIKSKDETIKSKDEMIESLRETIKMLKRKQL